MSGHVVRTGYEIVPNGTCDWITIHVSYHRVRICEFALGNELCLVATNVQVTAIQEGLRLLRSTDPEYFNQTIRDRRNPREIRLGVGGIKMSVSAGSAEITRESASRLTLLSRAAVWDHDELRSIVWSRIPEPGDRGYLEGDDRFDVECAPVSGQETKFETAVEVRGWSYALNDRVLNGLVKAALLVVRFKQKENDLSYICPVSMTVLPPRLARTQPSNHQGTDPWEH